MIHVFQRLLPPGWVYPCTTEDISAQLAKVPTEDLEGLWAVGLVPATRRDCGANGRYFSAPKPVIYLLSYREALRYRLSPHTTRADVEHLWAVEIAYGMRIEQEGSRWVCQWETEALRRYTVEHVLMHEVGHHVCHCQRRRDGFTGSLEYGASEQFAEHYALRLRPLPGRIFD